MSNQYTYSVPFTEEQLYQDYVVNCMTQVEIAQKYNTSQRVVWRALKKMGIPTRKAYKRDQRGEKNTNWKGGRVLRKATRASRPYSKGGYIWIKNAKHPLANKDGYIAEHIMVALVKYKLEKMPQGNLVHHIDMNKTNNDANNRLTPKECWRLQGFTDEQHDKAVAAGVSDSQRYKQAGNAISVNIAYAIGLALKGAESE